MNLLLVRHAIAADKDEWAKAGEDEHARPLTRDGRKKFQKCAAGVTALLPAIDLLATSPLTRATQTAEILADLYGGLKHTHVGALAPGKKPADVLGWLRSHKSAETIALVGHEPDMGTLACWLLTGLQESFIVLKKGGMLLIDFEKELRPGRGKLRWMMTPGQLRKM